MPAYTLSSGSIVEITDAVAFGISGVGKSRKVQAYFKDSSLVEVGGYSTHAAALAEIAILVTASGKSFYSLRSGAEIVLSQVASVVRDDRDVYVQLRDSGAKIYAGHQFSIVAANEYVVVIDTAVDAVGSSGAQAEQLGQSDETTGAVARRIGATVTEGLETRVWDKTITPTAIENALFTVPAGAIIRAIQSSVEVTLVGGSTSIEYCIGVNADPDSHTAASNALTAGTKTNAQVKTTTSGVMFEDEATVVLVLTACTAAGAIGDTVFSAGSVRVRVVYDILVDLD